MGLTAGDRFGSYEVVELIGVGGMGEVYRARDTRLHRDVAIKTLPDAHRLNDDALRRFEREARLLASLNHPNIATLHGIETAGESHALVMELVDGETLDDTLLRAPRRALRPSEALPIARQIADALDAAHERGVVHRDLKPANVKIRSDGTVKVLDFGIAKVFDAQAHGSENATLGATAMQAAIVGTPSYMSPEQASGGTVDRRADIWAFGCVLYEMLAGQRAFDGDTASSTLARVIEREPDWSKLPADLPHGIRVLLRQCLEKNPRKRRRDAGDLCLDIDQALAAPQPAPRARAAATRQRLSTAVIAVLALATAGLLALQLFSRPPAAKPELLRFMMPAPAGATYATSLTSGSGAPVGGSISPDGRQLAFTARDASGTILLWVRPLDSLEARALPATEDAALPFWSPDSKTIGFFSPRRLNRIDTAGGAPQMLCTVGRGQGGAWSRNGTIVFGADLQSGLRRVSATGGDCAEATELADGERAHRFPHFLADGEHFTYHVDAARADASGVFVASLSAPAGRRVLAADSGALLAPPSYLLFVRRSTLFAQAFDAATIATQGEPVPLAQGVSAEGGAPAFSASDTGVLTYRIGPADSDDQQFAWFDRTGKRLELVGPPGTYRGVDLSPDGTRLAVHDHKDNGGDIWIFEPRGTTTRVTFDPAFDNSSPVWSPDGREIAFGSLRNGNWGIYAKAASGEGRERLLLESPLPKIPASWSADGMLAYWLYEQAPHQWAVPVSGGEPARLLADSTAYDGHSQISPDGRWVAYMSSQTGRAEVYVRPFPAGEGARQVSTSGGVTPRWRRDGKELYYMTSYDHGTLMAVPIDDSDGTLVPGKSERLFVVDIAIVPHSTLISNFHTYAVSPDGQRFVLPLSVTTLQGQNTASAIAVVLNWTALLGR